MAFGDFTYGTTNNKGRVYDCYMRATTAFSTPANKAAHDAIISACEHIGTMATGSTIKHEDGPNSDTVDGLMMMNSTLKVEGKIMELSVTNINALKDADRNAYDIFFVEQDGDVGDMVHVIKNVPFYFRIDITGGGEQFIPLRFSKIETTPGDVMETYAIPAAA